MKSKLSLYACSILFMFTCTSIAVAAETATTNFTELEQSALAGDVNAQALLGYSYLNGIGVEADKEKAIQWYEKAADGGSAKAQLALAEMFWGGNGPNIASNEASRWFKMACESEGDDDCKGTSDAQKISDAQKAVLSLMFPFINTSFLNAEPLHETDNRYYKYNDYSVSIKMDDDACMQATLLEKPTTVMGTGITYRDGACHITAVVKDDVTAIDMPRKTIKLPIRWGKTIKQPIRWGESKASKDWDSSEVSTVTLKLQSDS